MIDALPIVFDEIENDSREDADRNEKVLKMARYASSSQAGTSLKGRADQSGAESYTCRSAFCFSSITPSVKHYADINRITLLPLQMLHGQSKKEAQAHYDTVLDNIQNIMGNDRHDMRFSEKFTAYAVANVHNIRLSYEVIKKEIFFFLEGSTQRVADQVGALLAGYWAYSSSEIITPEQAKALLRPYNWEDLIPSAKQQNQIQLVSKLAQFKLYFRNEETHDTRQITRTIADILHYITYPDIGEHPDTKYYPMVTGERLLCELGIKTESTADGKFVLIANSSEGLAKILQGTQWALNWKNSFKAIPDSYIPNNSHWFGNAIGQQRCIGVPLEVFINPPEA
jgi:hypothetical protein